MAEEIDQGSSDRQASWVALRTLRQRPRVVGRTEDGATVYEVRSVRLVLSPGSAHFKRLMQCARCGRDVPGTPILAPADLERPANSVFCDRCVRSPGPARPEISREKEDPPAPVLDPTSEPVVDDGVLHRLSEQVAGVLRGQNAELAKMAASMADLRAEISGLGASNQALAAQLAAYPGADIETKLAHELVEVRASVAAMVDATAQSLRAALTDGLDELRSEIASLQQDGDEESTARSQIGQIADAIRALAEGQGHLDRRTGELAAQLAAHPGAEIEAKLAQELVDVRASLAAMVDAAAQPLRAALADGLAELRSEIASRQQADDEESTARSQIGQIVDAIRALAEGQGHLDRRTGELAAQLAALPGEHPEAVGPRDLADLREDLAAMIGTADIRLRAEVAEGLELLRGEIASLEQRSRDEFTAIAALRQRVDDDLSARSEIGRIVDANRQLASAQGDLDQRMRELTAQVAALPGENPAAVGPRDLADLRADLAATIGGADTQLRAEVAEGLALLRREIASLGQRSREELAAAAAVPQRDYDESGARSKIGQIAGAVRALAQDQGDLDRRMRELATQLPALPGQHPEAVGARYLADLRADLVATIGAGDTHVRAEAAKGLELLRGEIASLEERSRDEFAAVAALLEAQRKELTEALHDVAHEILMSVAEPLRDLTKAREEFERRLDGLSQGAQQDQRRVEALKESLEQKLQAPPKRRAQGALIDSFERQLREAEERLSQL